MKRCARCGVEKTDGDFPINRTLSSGLHSYCWPCQRELCRSYHERHKAARNSVRRENYAANPMPAKKQTRDYYRKNREKILAHSNDRHLVNATAARRRARKVLAAAGWRNDFFINEIYDLARLRAQYLGVPHHVDHVVPLQSKFVCGLHVEHNLRVIPATQNQEKHNSSWPDMP